MATNNMHNLTTLIKRLEAATSRLEDMASSTMEPVQKPQSTALAAATASAAAAAAAGGQPAQVPTPPTVPKAPVKTVEPLPESIEEFDAFLQTAVKRYLGLSAELSGPVAEQALHVSKAFDAQRKFLLITTKAKKPDVKSQDYAKLLEPLTTEIGAVAEVREKNRGSQFANQLSAVADSIGVLGWVTVDRQPFKHVEEMLSSAQYFGNRVLKEFKDKDPKQVQWIQSYYQIFKDLAEYVKNTFPQGIPWNPKGISAAEAAKATTSAAPAPAAPAPAPAAGGPPPPPPPPPGPPPRFEIPETVPSAPGGIGAVFSELNKGEAVTKGLKKVNPNEMTHKNPSLRAGSTVPTRSDSQTSVSSVNRGKSPVPSKKPKPETLRTKKPPKKELDGNKWLIENYDNESEVVEIEASISHSILISRCSKTTIRIHGKANAISIDNSPRLSLVIDSLVSSVDVIKAQSFALQVLGTLPTILMDQVDGAQIYLSKDSMNTEVFSSKCSGINLNIMEGEDDDFKEVALPEQIRTYITPEGKVVSEIVEHAG